MSLWDGLYEVELSNAVGDSSSEDDQLPGAGDIMDDRRVNSTSSSGSSGVSTMSLTALRFLYSSQTFDI